MSKSNNRAAGTNSSPNQPSRQGTSGSTSRSQRPRINDLPPGLSAGLDAYSSYNAGGPAARPQSPEMPRIPLTNAARTYISPYGPAPPSYQSPYRPADQTSTIPPYRSPFIPDGQQPAVQRYQSPYPPFPPQPTAQQPGIHPSGSIPSATPASSSIPPGGRPAQQPRATPLSHGEQIVPIQNLARAPGPLRQSPSFGHLHPSGEWEGEAREDVTWTADYDAIRADRARDRRWREGRGR